MIRILLSSLKRYVSCFFLLVLTTSTWGFDLTRHSAPVPALSIQVIPKDAIPAIDHPELVPASEIDDLAPEEQVIGVAIGEEARAYPIRILHGHEIVNDDVGGRPIAVTWWPLTVSGVVYDRNVGEHTLSFGVSGRLYHNNLLLYDRQTDSLWSQITAEAVAGRMTGAKLRIVPFMMTTWREWRLQHPQSRVVVERRVPAIFSALGKTLQTLLSPLTGIHWPLSARPRTALDELVLGVTMGEVQKAYPLDMLARVAPLTDAIAGVDVRLIFVLRSAFAYAEKITGERLPSVVTYRMTWNTFYPRSEFYSLLR